MLLGDDIHDIFALINGKIVSFLVQNMHIISVYLLPHPSPSHPISSYCLYISICDRFVTPQLLRILYEFGTGV